MAREEEEEEEAEEEHAEEARVKALEVRVNLYPIYTWFTPGLLPIDT